MWAEVFECLKYLLLSCLYNLFQMCLNLWSYCGVIRIYSGEITVLNRMEALECYGSVPKYYFSWIKHIVAPGLKNHDCFFFFFLDYSI